MTVPSFQAIPPPHALARVPCVVTRKRGHSAEPGQVPWLWATKHQPSCGCRDEEWFPRPAPRQTWGRTPQCKSGLPNNMS